MNERAWAKEHCGALSLADRNVKGWPVSVILGHYLSTVAWGRVDLKQSNPQLSIIRSLLRFDSVRDNEQYWQRANNDGLWNPTCVKMGMKMVRDKDSNSMLVLVSIGSHSCWTRVLRGDRKKKNKPSKLDFWIPL